MKHTSVIFAFILTAVSGLISSCASNLNPVHDKHFDEDGHLLPDYQDSLAFEPTKPSGVKFYVEVSGSMNGFFRPNKPTQFKADVWDIITYYSSLASEVNILTNDGSLGTIVGLSEFQRMMNTGQFVSTASTKLPVMLETIISHLDTDAGETAVLISDMKYSPVGNAAPDVLMTQYSTDISHILGKYGKAVCLIGATSDYIDRLGNVQCARSPYYYLVIGAPRQVASIRNSISMLLDDAGHFIDNIESGFDYGHARFNFGFPIIRCEQFENEPTFYNYEDPCDGDTCTVRLNLNLHNYRWLLADKSVLSQCLKAKPLHGSELKVKIDTVNIRNNLNQELVRDVVATVDLQLFNMLQDADVIEWTLQLPDTDITHFDEFLSDATDEDDVSKSYSVRDFIKGMLRGGAGDQIIKPNYILVTKNN